MDNYQIIKFKKNDYETMEIFVTSPLDYGRCKF
jgi:hypothetical protein